MRYVRIHSKFKFTYVRMYCTRFTRNPCWGQRTCIRVSRIRERRRRRHDVVVVAIVVLCPLLVGIFLWITYILRYETPDPRSRALYPPTTHYPHGRWVAGFGTWVGTHRYPPTLSGLVGSTHQVRFWGGIGA